MKHACLTLFVLSLCTGCDRDQLPSKIPVSETVPPTATSEYPRLEWTVPKPSVRDVEVSAASNSVWPASVVGMRERFTKRLWAEANKPTFTVWLTENDFFRIAMAPDSQKMVGTVKITRVFDSGSMRGEVSRVEFRTTQPFASERQALSLLEAYLKQDGTFDTLVQWSDAESDGSNSDSSEQSL